MRFFSACAVISLLVTVIIIREMSSRGSTYAVLDMVYNHPRDTFRLLQSLKGVVSPLLLMQWSVY